PRQPTLLRISSRTAPPSPQTSSLSLHDALPISGGTGLELLQEMQERGYDVPLVMVTGYGSIEHAVTAVKAGAVDYVTKPIRPKQDRKSTRLNSSHVKPSYAVFCLKKQNRTHPLA